MNNLKRRQFLQSALLAGGALTIGGALPRRLLGADKDDKRTFLPVKVSRERLIRSVVGLRPYRPGGFNVEAEQLGNKRLVHNYGHGGAGITLSWGSASLALDLARNFGANRCAVIGCGVIGLSTARLFQRRGGAVTLYAKDLPPETTSNIAGGFWYPTSVFDDTVVTTCFTEQFRLAKRISHRAFQDLVGPEYGVRWIDTFEMFRNEASLNRDLTGGNDLYPAKAIHRDPDHYFGFPYVKQFSTMLIEPPVYLNALLRDFYIAGGKLVVKEFHGREEIMRLPAQVIFNCTGLGAKALFADEQMEPVRGQLEVLLPQPEIDYCYLGSGYMFPRADGIVLGGTFDHGDWSLTPKPEQTTEILQSHAEIMKALKQ